MYNEQDIYNAGMIIVLKARVYKLILVQYLSIMIVYFSSMHGFVYSICRFICLFYEVNVYRWRANNHSVYRFDKVRS